MRGGYRENAGRKVTEAGERKNALRIYLSDTELKKIQEGATKKGIKNLSEHIRNLLIKMFE